MLDIQSLERRWLRYKLKRSLPYAIIMLISIFGYGIYTLFLPSSSLQRSERITPKQAPIKPQHLLTSTSHPEVILEPSMNFMESINPSSMPIPVAVPPPVTPKDSVKHPPVPVNSQLPKETVFQSPIPTKEIIATKSTITDRKSPSPIVKRDESPLNINELQERFQSNPNPNLGVFIARYHYDHGNYPEAYNYALKTNAINNKMEESWIIFSKSLIKMGKIDQARKTLQLYIGQSNSDNAKNLLDSLEKDPKR